MTLAEIVACVILAHGSHVHDAEVARVEAEAFIANVQPHVPLELLLAVGYVESRFGVRGSARDVSNQVFGIMQIRCENDYDSYFDPVVNIRRGASLLALRYRQAHAASRVSARARSSWVASYYWGSVPATRRRAVVRRFYAYAGRVANAQRLMHTRMAQCRRPN